MSSHSRRTPVAPSCLLVWRKVRMNSREGGAPFRSRWTSLCSGTNTVVGEEEGEGGSIVVVVMVLGPVCSTC